MIPTFTVPEQLRQRVETFGGLNRSARIQAGEFAEMENLTSDCFPVAAVRQGRKVISRQGDIRGLVSKDNLGYVQGSRFVLGGYPVELGLSPGEKQMVSMGAYVVIFPDKKYVNTADLEDHGSLEADFVGSGAVCSPCDGEGVIRFPEYVQQEVPENPPGGALWLDTSGSAPVLRQWAAVQALWTEVQQTYVKIQCSGIGRQFRELDGVTLSGCGELDGSCILWKVEEDAVVISGLIRQEFAAESCRVQRKVPQMDLVVECGNRLWGCRYGVSASGEQVNEIYASKLGDFRNWRCFLGTAADSYAASVGSDGAFTGAVNHLGQPVFFKEGCIHRVYGSYPAAFRIQTTPCPGVAGGCSRSLAMVGQVLYYLSGMGVCAYDGAVPRVVSQNLGAAVPQQGVAGAVGEKYYLSALTPEGRAELLVYDTRRGLWHREDDFRAAEFCCCRGRLFAVEESSGILWQMDGGEEPVGWSARTGMLEAAAGAGSFLSGLRFRVALPAGSRMAVALRYDSRGRWHTAATLRGRGMEQFTLSILPRRCGHLEIRLWGTGEMKLYSLEQVFTEGGSGN